MRAVMGIGARLATPPPVVQPAPVPPHSVATPTIRQVPSPNHYDGRAGHSVIAVCLHTMGGTLASTDGWFANPASQVSAHFGVGLDGAIHQYVSLTDGSWANGIRQAGNRWSQIDPSGTNPNFRTVSIETEDNGSGATAVTNAQYAAVLSVVRLALATYPGIRYLVSHRDISPIDRPNCPGDRWWASGRFDALAQAAGLATL